MNENGKKKREWVKTAAIVFLSVMLVLTFFSNTIMNYSLPEVATQYVQSGTITAKIRGSGTVESGDPYYVEVKESRKVASVAVRAGQEVQKGEVLMYLEDEESEELKAARKALEEALDAYDTALLAEDLTTADINEANAGTSATTYRQQLTTAQNALKGAQNAVKAAKKEVEDAEANVRDLEQWKEALGIQISVTPESNADVTKEQKALDEAVAAYNTATADANKILNQIDETDKEIIRLTTEIEKKKEQGSDENSGGESGENSGGESGENAGGESGEKPPTLESLQNDLTAATQEKIKLESQYASAQNKAEDKAAVVAAAQAALDAKKASGSTAGTIANLTNQQKNVEVEIFHAKNTLEDKRANLEKQQELLVERQDTLTELVSKFGRVAGLEDAQKAIDDARKLVDELTAKAIDATITAPISGTITQLNVTAGTNTNPDTPVAVLQPEGKGYTLSFSVTNEQARRLSVGDVADLVNAWRYDDVTVTLANIRPDPDDPGQRKRLTFDVTGNVTAGQTLNLSVGQKSANYDFIVPNSAIREDNNGKFILIVESRQGPLSTRYMASRVDVEVIASDDTQSAISAALYGYEFVITTSTKPVEAGKQVRLSNN